MWLFSTHIFKYFNNVWSWHAVVDCSQQKFRQFFTLLISMNFLEIFDTEDCYHKTVFCTFICDFLCFCSITSATLDFRSSSLTGYISFTGLKWPKEKKSLYFYIHFLWNWIRPLLNTKLVTRHRNLHKQASDSPPPPKLQGFQFFFLKSFRKII